jgi:5-formyltetrahydrofolate cyclo-ligase
MNKTSLRTDLLARRRAMSHMDVDGKSVAIHQRLADLEAFKAARTVLTYVSSKDNEVDTQQLIVSLQAQGRQVLVPIALRGVKMLWSHLSNLKQLRPSSFGVLEPPAPYRHIVEPPGDAVCVTPGMGFTRQGYRIGYGGGYYDRFLDTFQGVSIGLCFHEQLIDTLHPEIHDQPVNILVTDCETYQCQPVKE